MEYRTAALSALFTPPCYGQPSRELICTVYDDAAGIGLSFDVADYVISSIDRQRFSVGYRRIQQHRRRLERMDLVRVIDRAALRPAATNRPPALCEQGLYPHLGI
jgi:hypothetical protein